MDPYVVSHLSNAALLRDLKTIDDHDRKTTALLLSRIAEVDERRLYLEEGCPSMYAYCVQELHYCEGTASRRIYAARAARRFPILFDAIADGRLHVTAVVMLSKYLTAGNVDELVAAATHKSKAEIERLIAERFPRPDFPEMLRAIDPPSWVLAMAPPQLAQHSPENAADAGQAPEHSLENARLAVPAACPPPLDALQQHSPENAAARASKAVLKPLAPERFGIQFTLDREAFDLLDEARALEGQRNPTGEILAAFKNAFRCYVGELRKQKFAETRHPRPSRPTSSARHIPAAVKRAVRERDGERCAFVSESGRRCQERARLEFDHIEPVARGGESTAQNVRLVCRAHNHHAADRVFGAEFMDRKRRESGGGRG